MLVKQESDSFLINLRKICMSENSIYQVVTHAHGIVTRENQEKEIERQVP